MARRKTYGESMADWEREREEADWRRRLSIAISAKNQDSVNLLIKEGKSEGYDIPNDIPSLPKK